MSDVEAIVRRLVRKGGEELAALIGAEVGAIERQLRAEFQGALDRRDKRIAALERKIAKLEKARTTIHAPAAVRSLEVVK